MRTAVFFALEYTLLRGEAQFAFLRWAARHGRLPPAGFRRGLLNYLRHRFSIVRQAEGPGADGFAFLAGCSVAGVESSAGEFFAAKLARRLHPQAVALVAAHRRRGHVTVLLTPAAEAVARPIAKHLAVDILLATRLGASGGRFIGRSLSPQACGEGKRFVAQTFCDRFGADPARSYAYASRISDASLLELVGHPIAADPDRRLRELARKKGWRIVDLDAGEPEVETPLVSRM